MTLPASTIDKEQLGRHLFKKLEPFYRQNDTGHQIDHAIAVNERALQIVERVIDGHTIDKNMVLVIAFYHDAGLYKGHADHHLTSAQMLRDDAYIAEMFSADQIKLMAEAIEDHRSSCKYEPRSMYGMIISDADRDIVPSVIVGRFRACIYAEIEEWNAPTRQHASEAWTYMLSQAPHAITDAMAKEETYFRFHRKYAGNGRGTVLQFNLPIQVQGLQNIQRVASNYQSFSEEYDKLPKREIQRKVHDVRSGAHFYPTCLLFNTKGSTCAGCRYSDTNKHKDGFCIPSERTV